ncbi:guanine nucleotide-binding protein subunit alpha [archaeon]|nr:MAG: guanine nucleotide-binding protein subunit alpha [archaeon]
MGCTVSVQPGGKLIANNKVQAENEAEKLLKQSREEEKYIFKILLLGAGESGKSTVVKQIKIIYDVNEPTYEKQKYKQALQRNVIEAMQTLLSAAKQLNIPLANPDLEEASEKIIALDSDSRITLQQAPMIDQLWKDVGIQKVYARRDEYWNMDGTPYYLNEVYRIADNSFAPNEEDMIMARIRTTGIVISEVVETPYKFQVVDVGGQRSERRKWIHCFDDVKAIIYLASLSGYNQSKISISDGFVEMYALHVVDLRCNFHTNLLCVWCCL